MLSAAKVKLHGMQDERWVTSDKLAQYKGLLELCERDKVIRDVDAGRSKKRRARELRALQQELDARRDELSPGKSDARFLQIALHDHTDLQLAHSHSAPEKVLEWIHQENFNKRKQLDRMAYTTKQRMDLYRKRQLETAELKDLLLYEIRSRLPSERREQAVANQVQCANIKKHAALAIRAMYIKILDILKKDASYYTVLLEALKEDCRAQGHCLMGATEMGQLAMEYLDDRKFEFSLLENEIEANMKERERSLSVVRAQIRELNDCLPLLIRKETVNLHSLYEEEEVGSIQSVHWELDEVLVTCKVLMRGTLVSSFQDIVVSLKSQDRQSEGLRSRLDLAVLRRDALLDSRERARLALNALLNSGQEESIMHLQELKELETQLETEEKEEEELQKIINAKEVTVMEVRTALLHLTHILSHIGDLNGEETRKEKKIRPLPQVHIPHNPLEMNPEKLLATCKSKVAILSSSLGGVKKNITMHCCECGEKITWVKARKSQPKIEFKKFTMLTAAKVKLHGMQDERWVTSDKLAQYKGLLELYERDKEIRDVDAGRNRRRRVRELRALQQELDARRDELSPGKSDARFLQIALHDHRDLQLAHSHSAPEKVLEWIHQENFNKRKQLDRMAYTTKQRMDLYRKRQLEAAELRDHLLYEIRSKLPSERREQAVANQVQCANIKKNAALAIRAMYIKILDILKKDASYYTVLLEALKEDCRAQGHCLMGATEMGQLAMEYLDDRKFEFSRLEDEIKANMKERERSLGVVRAQIRELNDCLPLLIRKEAVNLHSLYEEEEVSSIQSVHWELDEVLVTCKILLRGTLVSSFEDIVVSLKSQDRQSEGLRSRLDLAVLRRDALLDSRERARLALNALLNSGQEESIIHLQQKKELETQLETDEKEKEELQKIINAKEDKVMEVRTALLHLTYILSHIEGGEEKRKEKKVRLPVKEITPENPLEMKLEKLLATCKSKVAILSSSLGGADVSSELREAAQNEYHDALLRVWRENYVDESAEESAKAILDYEMEEPSVPTRDSIKLRSRLLVEAAASDVDNIV